MKNILEHLQLAEKHLKDLNDELAIATSLITDEDKKLIRSKLSNLVESQKEAKKKLEKENPEFLKFLIEAWQAVGENHISHLYVHGPGTSVFLLENGNFSYKATEGGWINSYGEKSEQSLDTFTKCILGLESGYFYQFCEEIIGNIEHFIKLSGDDTRGSNFERKKLTELYHRIDKVTKTL